MDANSIMRPGHPRWREFLARLDAIPRCTKTTENAQVILATMQEVDVDRSLSALRELGGCCDCAILYDVEGASTRSGTDAVASVRSQVGWAS
jgi:hypothetical protein